MINQNELFLKVVTESKTEIDHFIDLFQSKLVEAETYSDDVLIASGFMESVSSLSRRTADYFNSFAFLSRLFDDAAISNKVYCFSLLTARYISFYNLTPHQGILAFHHRTQLSITFLRRFAFALQCYSESIQDQLNAQQTYKQVDLFEV